MNNPSMIARAGVILGLFTGAAVAQVDQSDGGQGTAVGGGGDEAFQAKRYGVEHYSRVWSKSPFDFEIRVAEEEKEEENPFENLKLAGLVQRGGEYSVSIYDEKGEKGARIQLRSGDEGNEDGFTIVRVERGKNFKETKVHVRKGNNVGVIEYDTKKIEAKATGAVGGSRPTANAQRSSRGAPRGAANPPQNAKAAQGGTQKSAQEARNEVIKRLLEKAKQNQGGQGATSQGKSQPEKKRRVVLPPPK